MDVQYEAACSGAMRITSIAYGDSKRGKTGELCVYFDPPAKKWFLRATGEFFPTSNFELSQKTIRTLSKHPADKNLFVGLTGQNTNIRMTKCQGDYTKMWEVINKIKEGQLSNGPLRSSRGPLTPNCSIPQHTSRNIPITPQQRKSPHHKQQSPPPFTGMKDPLRSGRKENIAGATEEDIYPLQMSPVIQRKNRSFLDRANEKSSGALNAVSSPGVFYSRSSQSRTSTPHSMQRSYASSGLSSQKRRPGILGMPRSVKQPRLADHVKYSWQSPITQTERKSLQGFSNLGNTCYMNSILQSLFALETFHVDLLRLNNQVRHSSALPDTKLYQALGLLLLSKLSNKASPDKLRHLLAMVKRTISSTAKRFSGHQQHDAHEFLGQVVDQLKEEVVTINKKNPSVARQQHDQLDEVCSPLEERYINPAALNFEFEVMHSLRCLDCDHLVTKEESFHDLSLDMPRLKKMEGAPSIQDALDLFFAEEELEYTCEQCHSQRSQVYHTFTKLPRILVLHLKRYNFDSYLTVQSKVGSEINIPNYLTLRAHCTEETQPSYPPNIAADPLRVAPHNNTTSCDSPRRRLEFKKNLEPNKTPLKDYNFKPATPPSRVPSTTPSRAPFTPQSRAPSTTPSRAPSTTPSRAPSATPSRAPSTTPSRAPSATPSRDRSTSDLPQTHVESLDMEDEEEFLMRKYEAAENRKNTPQPQSEFCDVNLELLSPEEQMKWVLEMSRREEEKRKQKQIFEEKSMQKSGKDEENSPPQRGGQSDVPGISEVTLGSEEKQREAEFRAYNGHEDFTENDLNVMTDEELVRIAMERSLQGTALSGNDHQGTALPGNDHQGTALPGNDHQGTALSENDHQGTALSENVHQGTVLSENVHQGTAESKLERQYTEFWSSPKKTRKTPSYNLPKKREEKSHKISHKDHKKYEKIETNDCKMSDNDCHGDSTQLDESDVVMDWVAGAPAEWSRAGLGQVDIVPQLDGTCDFIANISSDSDSDTDNKNQSLKQSRSHSPKRVSPSSQQKISRYFAIQQSKERSKMQHTPESNQTLRCHNTDLSQPRPDSNRPDSNRTEKLHTVQSESTKKKRVFRLKRVRLSPDHSKPTVIEDVIMESDVVNNNCDNLLDNIGDNPLDNIEDNPLDNVEDNPLDNVGDNPLDNIGDNPLDNIEDNPLDNPHDDVGENQHDNIGDNPVNNLQENEGDNPFDNPQDNLYHNVADNKCGKNIKHSKSQVLGAKYCELSDSDEDNEKNNGNHGNKNVTDCDETSRKRKRIKDRNGGLAQEGRSTDDEENSTFLNKKPRENEEFVHSPVRPDRDEEEDQSFVTLKSKREKSETHDEPRDFAEALARDISSEDKENQTPSEERKEDSDWLMSRAEKKEKEQQELERAIQMSLQEQPPILTEEDEEEQIRKATELSLRDLNGDGPEWMEENHAEEKDLKRTEEEVELLAKNAETGQLPYSYQLMSVVSHLGRSSAAGHYISDVYDLKKKQWMSYDDSHVSQTSEMTVTRSRRRTGYIFFYMNKDVVDELKSGHEESEQTTPAPRPVSR